jgi:hypothetical protein
MNSFPEIHSSPSLKKSRFLCGRIEVLAIYTQGSPLDGEQATVARQFGEADLGAVG